MTGICAKPRRSGRNFQPMLANERSLLLRTVKITRLLSASGDQQLAIACVTLAAPKSNQIRTSG